MKSSILSGCASKLIVLLGTVEFEEYLLILEESKEVKILMVANDSGRLNFTVLIYEVLKLTNCLILFLPVDAL